MRNILLSTLLLCLGYVQAQKIEFNKESKTVTVDGKPSFKLVRENCGFGMVDCHYDIFDTEGNRVIRMTFKSFKSPIERSKNNPDGNVNYYELLFLDSKQKAEVAWMGLKEKWVSRFIVQSKLFKDGKLDDKMVEEFILVHGTPYQERVKF